MLIPADAVAREKANAFVFTISGTKAKKVPVKIGFSLVPYATTVWDFISRAMPQSKPGSLTVNEVYAATAYVLYRNDIIKETDVLDAKTLPQVRMPNRDNFLPAEPGWKPGQKRPFGYYP